MTDVDREQALRRALKSSGEIVAVSYTSSWWYGMGPHASSGKQTVRLARSDHGFRGPAEIEVQGLLSGARAGCKREFAFSPELFDRIAGDLRNAAVAYGYATSDKCDAGWEQSLEVRFVGNHDLAFKRADARAVFWGYASAQSRPSAIPEPEPYADDDPFPFVPQEKEVGIECAPLSQLVEYLEKRLQFEEQSNRLRKVLTNWAKASRA